MRPGLGKIIEKVRIWRNFEHPEDDRHTVAYPCWIDYADPGLSKRVPWLLKIQCADCCTTNDGCNYTAGLDTAFPWASLRTIWIHMWVAYESKIQLLLATPHNAAIMDQCLVGHWSFKASPILHPVDVEKAYGYSSTCYHLLHWHVSAYGWCCPRFI